MRKLLPHRREALAALASCLSEDCFRVVIDACVRQWISEGTCNEAALMAHLGISRGFWNSGHLFATLGGCDALLQREAIRVYSVGGIRIYIVGDYLWVHDFKLHIPE